MTETALVTGASGGIGRELARILAREGFAVVLVARSADKLADLARELRERHGTRIDVIQADLAEPDGPAALAARVRSEQLTIDVLVNNAGVGLNGRFAETDMARELAMIQLNVTSLTELTKRFLPGMLERRRGRILNVASTAAFQAGPMMAVYYATKAYVLSFSEAIANELSGSGVTVTALCPGPTQSGFQNTAGMGEANLFKGPTVADSVSVAEAGYRAMMKGERVHIAGLINRIGAFGTRLVPRGVAASIARALQDRK